MPLVPPQIQTELPTSDPPSLVPLGPTFPPLQLEPRPSSSGSVGGNLVPLVPPQIRMELPTNDPPSPVPLGPTFPPLQLEPRPASSLPPLSQSG